MNVIIRRKFFLIGFLFLLCLLSAFGQTAGKLTLKSGAIMEYSDARLDGDIVVVTLPHGSMRLKKSAISDISLQQLGMNPEPAANSTASTAISTATAEMVNHNVTLEMAAAPTSAW